MEEEEFKHLRIVRLAILRQWFHSIFALVNSNRPYGMFGKEDPNYKAANDIQAIAWSRYCALGSEISELKKGTILEGLV